MANSLEFSGCGHPIENRCDGYGEPMDDGYPMYKEIWADADPADYPPAIHSSEIDDYDPFAPLSEEDERQERIDRLAATIQVRPDSNCIAGWEYLAFVPGFEEEGWDHHGPTPEAARESLIDYLQVVVQ